MDPTAIVSLVQQIAGNAGQLFQVGAEHADKLWGKDYYKRTFAGNSYVGGSPSVAGMVSGAYSDIKASSGKEFAEDKPWFTGVAELVGAGLSGIGGQGYDTNAIMQGIEDLKAKSGIHIKKENRGKFTSYCGGKVTAECIRKGLHSSNPTTRKRANFARNARKWNHAENGMEIVGPSHENGGVPIVVVIGNKQIPIEAEGGEKIIKRPNGDVAILNKEQQAQQAAGKPIAQIIEGLPEVKAQNGVVVTEEMPWEKPYNETVMSPRPAEPIPIETWGRAPGSSIMGPGDIGVKPSYTFDWTGGPGPASHAYYDQDSNELSGVMVTSPTGASSYTVDESGNFIPVAADTQPAFFDEYMKDLKRSKVMGMINNGLQFGQGLSQYLQNRKARGPENIQEIAAAFPLFSWMSPDIPLQALERGFIRTLRQGFEFGGRDRASDVYTRFLAGVRDIGARYAAINSQGMMGTSQAVAQALNAVNLGNADIKAKNIATQYQWMKDKSLAMKTNTDLMNRSLYANQILQSQYSTNKLQANIYKYLAEKYPEGLAAMFTRGSYPYDYSGQAYWGGTYDPSQQQNSGLGK